MNKVPGRHPGFGKKFKCWLSIIAFVLSLVFTSLTTFVISPEEVQAASRKNFVIVLDPGHDDMDNRATVVVSGIHEPTYNLNIAVNLKRRLESYGFTVYMTRTTAACPFNLNEKGCLEARAKYAAGKNANVMISIHHNATSRDIYNWYTQSGSSIYICTRYQSRMSSLASYISSALLKYCNLPERTPLGYARASTERKNHPDGTKAEYYGLLYHASVRGIPSLIIEHGFSDNYHDATQRKTLGADYYAMADCEAIVSWYRASYEGATSTSIKPTGAKTASSSTTTTTTTASTSSTSTVGTAGYVGGTSVYLRSGSSTSKSVVTTLSQYDLLTVYEKTNNFFRVAAFHNGSVYNGYVSADYVKSGNPYTMPSGTSGYISATQVNLRSATSTSSSVVTVMDRGDKVKIYEQTNGWYHIGVTHKGSTYYGYVNSSYVSKGTYSGTSTGTSSGASGSSTTTGSSTGLVSGSSATVNTSSLNLRSSATTSSSIITVLSQGDKLSIISQSNGWAKVNAVHNGKNYTGYVNTSYIKTTSTTSTSSASSTSTGTVSCSGYLNVRSGNSTSYGVVGILYPGDKVTIVGSANGWYQIRFNKNGSLATGYVRADYIK